MVEKEAAMVGQLRKTSEIISLIQFEHVKAITQHSKIIGTMRSHCLLIIAFLINHSCGLYYNYPGDEILEEEHHDRPSYEFEYGVRDPSTGDLKKQWEIRKGDNVRGAYSLLEPDGTVRTVQYSADKHRGFNAVVTREGKSKHSRPFYVTPTRDQTHHVTKHPNFQLSHRDLSPTSAFYSSGKNAYQVSESARSPQYAAPEVPSNHNPVYKGVSNYKKLVNMYKAFREKNSDTRRHKFDYGINEYFANGFEALNRLSSRWRDVRHLEFSPDLGN